MRRIFADKRYSGYVWHFVFAGVFIGLSLLINDYIHGVTWYLISTVLRIVFGVAILAVAKRFFGIKASEIISLGNMKGAILAGTGFLAFFLYYVITVAAGFGKTEGLTLGIFLTRILLQQAATGFYEELNYRFLLLEGVKYSKNNTAAKILSVLISTVLFGLLHCVTGWNTYTFLQTGAIGFAFAVIFVKSGNILLPMILHFLYDVISNTAKYVEWNNNPVFDNLNSVFEIMLAAMFVISAVILFLPGKKKK